jgi:hypothetical protein
VKPVLSYRGLVQRSAVPLDPVDGQGVEQLVGQTTPTIGPLRRAQPVRQAGRRESLLELGAAMQFT